MDMSGLLSMAVERLIDLLKLPGKRLQLRFEQIWKPTYEDLERVNNDYYSMFQAVLAILSDTNTHPENPMDAYDKAIRFLKEKRAAFAPVRQKLLVLEALVEKEENRKFLVEEEIDFLYSVIRYIRGKSLPDITGSRSASLQSDLEIAARMDERVANNVLENLEVRIENLGKDWMVATKAYNQLQIAVIQKSM